MTDKEERLNHSRLVSARDILGEWHYRYRADNSSVDWDITIRRNVRRGEHDRSDIVYGYEISSSGGFARRGSRDVEYFPSREEALIAALDAVDLFRR